MRKIKTLLNINTWKHETDEAENTNIMNLEISIICTLQAATLLNLPAMKVHKEKYIEIHIN